MRKIIVLLFIAVLFVGCSRNHGKDPLVSPEDLGNHQSNQGAKPTSNPTPIGSGNESKLSMTDIFKEGEVMEFTGAVGDSMIHMSLTYQDEQLRGTYYYDKYRTEIGLTGAPESRYLDYPSIQLTEDTEQEGQFFGLFINEDRIEGYWKSWDKRYPMYLIRTGSKATQPKAPGEAMMQMDGAWYGANKTYFSGSDLLIHVLYDDLLYFELSAFNGTATGALSGFASYREGTAGITFLDHINWEDPNSDYVSFEFEFNSNQINLLSNQYDYGCGMGVSFEEAYLRDEPGTTLPSLMEVGIVKTKEQEELFIKTVNYAEHSFIRNTQSVMFEDILLDGRRVQAGPSYLRGASGFCYYIIGSDYIYAAIYEEGVIQYYTNDPSYANHMPDPMKQWSESYGSEIIYNEISAPYPFDSRLPQMLADQLEQLKKNQKISLPEAYTLKDYSFGDLDRDGQEDAAVVIEQGSGVTTGSRKIYLFLNQNGKYRLAFENSDIILGSMEGGVFGDPYEDISLSEGKLHVQDYGGSSDRWGHTYTFTYQDKQLILTEITVINYNTLRLNGTVATYDLRNKRAESRTMYEAWEEDPSGKNYNNLLIYEGRIILEEDITFAYAKAWGEEAFLLDPVYPMPSIDSFDGVQRDYSRTKFTAMEILDRVRDKYYPKMKKISIPYSREIQDNYSLLLGYEAPSYYYSDGVHDLYYYHRSFLEDTERYHHTVLYRSKKQGSSEEFQFYDYWDDTGEEEN